MSDIEQLLPCLRTVAKLKGPPGKAALVVYTAYLRKM